MSDNWWIVSLSRGMRAPASPLRVLGLDLGGGFATARIRSGRNARRLGAGTRVQLVGPQKLFGTVERASSQDGEYTMVVRLSGAT